MYWLYFIIFIFIVFIPDIIQQDFGFLPEEKVEEIVIFLLGAIGFALFMIQEKRILEYIREKASFLREANRMTKDLTHSYSYIGEINRKLDILKNIALGLPEAASFTPAKEREVYDSILEAIRILTKADSFVVRFVSENGGGKVLKELKGGKGVARSKTAILQTQSKRVLETDELLIVKSRRTVDDVLAYIAVQKKKKNHTNEDLDLLEAVASQALFVYAFNRERKALVNCQTNITPKK